MAKIIDDMVPKKNQNILGRDIGEILKTKYHLSVFSLLLITVVIFITAFFAGTQTAGVFQLFPRAMKFGTQMGGVYVFKKAEDTPVPTVPPKPECMGVKYSSRCDPSEQTCVNGKWQCPERPPVSGPHPTPEWQECWHYAGCQYPAGTWVCKSKEVFVSNCGEAGMSGTQEACELTTCGTPTSAPVATTAPTGPVGTPIPSAPLPKDRNCKGDQLPCDEDYPCTPPGLGCQTICHKHGCSPGGVQGPSCSWGPGSGWDACGTQPGTTPNAGGSGSVECDHYGGSCVSRSGGCDPGQVSHGQAGCGGGLICCSGGGGGGGGTSGPQPHCGSCTNAADCPAGMGCNGGVCGHRREC